MNNQTYRITLLADDISDEEFEAYLKKDAIFSLICTTVPPKEGRSLSEFLLALVTLKELSSGVLGNALYDLIKWSFQKLNESFGAKPNASVKMKNGNSYVIDRNMSNEDIREQIMDCLLEGEVESIHFDS